MNANDAARGTTTVVEALAALDAERAALMPVGIIEAAAAAASPVSKFFEQLKAEHLTVEAALAGIGALDAELLKGATLASMTIDPELMRRATGLGLGLDDDTLEQLAKVGRPIVDKFDAAAEQLVAALPSWPDIEPVMAKVPQVVDHTAVLVGLYRMQMDRFEEVRAEDVEATERDREEARRHRDRMTRLAWGTFVAAVLAVVVPVVLVAVTG